MLAHRGRGETRSPSKAFSSATTDGSKSRALFIAYFSLISPSKGTVRPSCGSSSVIFAASVSAPEIFFCCSALLHRLLDLALRVDADHLQELADAELNVSWSIAYLLERISRPAPCRARRPTGRSC